MALSTYLVQFRHPLTTPEDGAGDAFFIFGDIWRGYPGAVGEWYIPVGTHRGRVQGIQTGNHSGMGT